MDTTTVEANIKTVVDTKHNIENMIKRTSTTETIIKNTIKIASTTEIIIENIIRIASMIKREIITIQRQELEIRVSQEQERQEQVITTIGKDEVVIREVFNVS